MNANESDAANHSGMPRHFNRESVHRWLFPRPLEAALPGSMTDPLLAVLAKSFDAWEQQPLATVAGLLNATFRNQGDEGIPLLMVLHILRKRFQLESLIGTALNSQAVLLLLAAYRRAVRFEIHARTVGQSDTAWTNEFMVLIDRTPLNAPGVALSPGQWHTRL